MTTIEWTHAPGFKGETWNFLVGCSRVSAGCQHCYAERVVHRGMAEQHKGLTVLGPKGPRWTGEVRTVPERLDLPFRWKKPRQVFVNSLSDLFHEDVPDEFIAASFGVMAAAPEHRFLILTKRAERMARWFDRCGAGAQIEAAQIEVRKALGESRDDRKDLRWARDLWPLPNVWIGVSVEDQATAAERIPFLLGCPAAVRWISLEPQLGPVDLTHLDAERAGHPEMIFVDALRGRQTDMGRPCADVARLDWVVQGGESGPGARPFDLAWARSVRDQCREAGVAYFAKQLGSRPVMTCCEGCGEWEPGEHGTPDVGPCGPVSARRVELRDRKGGDPSEWPADLRDCRAWPGVAHG